MEILTSPKSRFGLAGAPMLFHVHAQGAAEVLLGAEQPQGLEVRLVHAKTGAEGVDADIEVRLTGASFD